MSIIFITIQGGLGNQLFQAALLFWLRKNWGISAKMIYPGGGGTPGPDTRICQLNELFPSENVISGFFAYLLHLLSLSRKWQLLFGSSGLVCSLADVLSLEQVLQHTSFGNRLLRRHSIFVFSAHWQRLGLLVDVIPFIQKTVSSSLEDRAARVDSWLAANQRAPLAETLVIHVRRGDVLTLSRAVLLGVDYYRNALDAFAVHRSYYPTAIAVVSDDPDKAIELVRYVAPSAYVLDLQDPVDVLAAMTNSQAVVLANSTLSLWAAILSKDRSCIVAPTIELIGACSWDEITGYLGVLKVDIGRCVRSH